MNPKVWDPPENSSNSNRAAILVLGVARSGTSLLAHILNILGVILPEQLLGAGVGNPFGHWEPMRLLKLNEEILSVLGRTWHDPRPIPPGWFRSREAYGFQERITEEILSLYGDAPLILIKEPRICRLAPLYLDALDVLGIRPMVILPIRHPVEVMNSICWRDGGDMRSHELRWLRHLIESEEASRNCVRVWTSFDGLLENWQTTIESVALGLGITWPNEPKKVSAEVAHIVRRRHRHFQIAKDAAHLPVGPLTSRAWQGALSALKGDEAFARALFDEIRTVMYELDRLSLPEQERIESRLDRAEVERRELEGLLQDSKAAAEAANAQCERLNLKLQELATQISHLRATLSEHERDVDHCEKLGNQLSQLQATLSERDRDSDRMIQQLRAELFEQVGQVEQLKGRVNSIHGSICWRLTWPIRWLHKQIILARSPVGLAPKF
jgi:hypothetical protein